VNNIEEKGDGSGHVTWNTTASAFMLNYLAEMVSNGTKTSSGFKKVHINMCARVINDQFKSKYTGENVKNHLRAWQRRYAKIIRLRKLSVAGWDEDSCRSLLMRSTLLAMLRYVLFLDAYSSLYVLNNLINTDFLNYSLFSRTTKEMLSFSTSLLITMLLCLQYLKIV
jgi:hypothetical protein